MVVEKQGRFIWLILAVLALLAMFMTGSHSTGSGIAQAQFGGDIVGQLTVVPIQISRDTFGVALVDNTTQTLCVYEFNKKGSAANHIRLFGVRSWKYDTQLEQYNTADPKPMQVKAMLEQFESKTKEKIQEVK